MPGAVRLGDLLRATYPGTSYGVGRSCWSDGFASEHYEGRAVDWMISLSDPAKVAVPRHRAGCCGPTQGAAVRQRPPARRHVHDVRRPDLGCLRAGEGWRPYSTWPPTPSAPRTRPAIATTSTSRSAGPGPPGARRSGPAGSPRSTTALRPGRPQLGGALQRLPRGAVPRAPDGHGTPGIVRGDGGAVPRRGHRLTPGAQGPLVGALQRSLGLAPDGSFGPRTGAAVSAFRTAHRLAAGQVVDAATWRQLLAAAAADGALPPDGPAPAPRPAPSPSPVAPGGTAAGSTLRRARLLPRARPAGRRQQCGREGRAEAAARHAHRLVRAADPGVRPRLPAGPRGADHGNVGPLTWRRLALLA